MSRKTLLIIVVVLLLACAVFFYLFFKQTPQTTEEVPTGSTCLVFQDSDPSKPCFLLSTRPTGGQNPATSSEPTVPVSPTASTTIVSPVESACGNAANGFEKNDCISTIARQKKDRTLCDAVTGILAQEACRTNVTATSSTATTVKAPQTYQDFVQKYFSTTATASPPASTIKPETSVPTVGPSDEAKVRYNLSYGAPLAVYAPSRYQVLPGSAFKIYGSGFLVSDNTLNIGSVQTTVGSADGNTIEATAPASTGDYERGVPHSKGSSKLTERTVKVTVTSSPAELPVIEKATPSPVSANGTVVLSGTGFAATNNILTSLGTLMNVPSDGHTISISMASLPYISYATGAAVLKGKISPVLVNIQTAGGVSEKIFQFDVQF